jgi:hypothetical protein
MDNLKKYLQQHLDELDSDVPGDEVWQKIQHTQAPVLPKKKVVKMVWRYAAAACVLAAMASIFFLVNKKSTNIEVASLPVKDTATQTEIALQTEPLQRDTVPNTATPQTATPTPKKNETPQNEYARKEERQKAPVVEKRQKTIDPTQFIINDVERNYTALVNLQLQRLKVTPVYAESPDYFSIFKQQYKQIERDEAAIKKDIQQHGLSDELLQQLININQQKLNVLKDLQAEVNKLNTKVRPSQNGVDSSRSYYLTM